MSVSETFIGESLPTTDLVQNDGKKFPEMFPELFQIGMKQHPGMKIGFFDLMKQGFQCLVGYLIHINRIRVMQDLVDIRVNFITQIHRFFPEINDMVHK